MDAPERPLVSAVLITRDRPDELRAAVASVRDQTYPTLELVVVDGSREPSESLVRRHAGDVPVTYRRDDGGGPGAARNIGIRAATGTFVAFLDDDDRWLPEKTERQVETFGPGVGTVYTGQFTARDGDRVGGRTPSLSLKLAAAAVGAGRYDDARRFARRSLRHDPSRRRGWLYLSVALGGRPTTPSRADFSGNSPSTERRVSSPGERTRHRHGRGVSLASRCRYPALVCPRRRAIHFAVTGRSPYSAVGYR